MFVNAVLLQEFALVMYCVVLHIICCVYLAFVITAAYLYCCIYNVII